MNILDTSHYMTGWECVNHNGFWGWATIFLCLVILIGYLRIAWHWYSNLKGLKPGLAKSSLFNMVNIFLFCGICGYLFIIIMMWWPIWQIRALFLTVLAVITTIYSLNTPKLKVVYEEIHNAGELTEQLAKQEQKNKELVEKTVAISHPIDKLSDSVFFGITDKTNPKMVEQINNIRSEIVKVKKMVDDFKTNN